MNIFILSALLNFHATEGEGENFLHKEYEYENIQGTYVGATFSRGHPDWSRAWNRMHMLKAHVYKPSSYHYEAGRWFGHIVKISLRCRLVSRKYCFTEIGKRKVEDNCRFFLTKVSSHRSVSSNFVLQGSLPSTGVTLRKFKHVFVHSLFKII